MQSGWQLDPLSKLAVPDSVIDRLVKTAEDRMKENGRKFMSSYKPAQAGSMALSPTGGENGPMPAPEPLPGALLSYNSMYQPWNLIGGWRKPTTTVPFQILRDVRRKSVIDNVIINTRRGQVKKFARPCWVPGKQMGYRVVHERYADPTFQPTPDIERRCEEVQRRLANVTPEIHKKIGDFYTMAVDEELTVDRKCMVVYRDEAGRPFQFHIIDGTTVKPRLQVLLPWMFANKTDNVDLASELVSYDRTRNPMGIDLTTAAYVQEVEGRFTAAWSAEQMSIDVANPTAQINHFEYGISLLEDSLEATSAWLLSWNFNKEMFKTNYPESILALLGDYDPQGLESFKRQILGEVGPGSNWRMPVITGPPGDAFKAEVLKLRDTPQEMLFGELLRFLVAIKCAAYRMHPSEINFSGDMGAGKSVFAHEDTQTEIATANEQGLGTLLDTLADWLTRAIVKQNYDDLEMVWEGRELRDKSAEIEDSMNEVTSYKLIDEVRAEKNLPPLPDGTGQIILNPVFAQQMQLQAQEDMLAQQEEQYDQGDFGEAGGDEGGGNPFGGGGDGEKQDSGGGGEQQWFAGKSKGDDKPKAKKANPRKPGQAAPEGAPEDAPFMNKKAKGKKGEETSDHEEKKGDLDGDGEVEGGKEGEPEKGSDDPKAKRDRTGSKKGPPERTKKSFTINFLEEDE